MPVQRLVLVPILSGTGRSSGRPVVARQRPSRWLQLMRADAGASRCRLVPCGIKVQCVPGQPRRDGELQARRW